METQVYRISAVLAGQSASVTVIGRDVAGRELQIELPHDRAHGLKSGQLLILHLSAHDVPPLESHGAAAAPVVEEAAVTTTVVTTAHCGGGTDEDEICRMLGLG